MTTDTTTKSETSCYQVLLLDGFSGDCLTQQTVRVPDSATDNDWNDIANDFQDEMACILYAWRERIRYSDFVTVEIPDCEPNYEALFDEEEKQWFVSPVKGFCDEEEDDDEEA